ncbi:MAG: site-specific integrase [Burkholderiaceae bacterium]|nr:site-specific integrase [Burkholderiaceae bacterium]
MASLFKVPGSPYWQLRYRDPDGKWRKKSLKFRHGIGTETAQARRACAQQTASEHGASREGEAALWKSWVQQWIDDHFTHALSRTRAINAWTHLSAWLITRGHITPAHVRHEHAAEYMRHRKQEGAAHNTALVEVKFMASILQSAVRRQLIPGNPWVKLGIKRARVREKPEITSEQAALVQHSLTAMNKPAWMHESWLIVTHQGCRITECRIPMRDIDDEAGIIWFEKTKGDRPFSTLIHPALRPLIAKKRVARATYLCDLPPHAAKHWWVFLRKKLKLPFSIHSTRVTVATQLARAKVDRTEAMRFLNHSTELVHRTYQRLRPQDLSAAVAAVGFSDTDERPGNPDSPPASAARG